uniref:Tetratricopeptide repeat domain 21A n=1 Tax=Pipistrellus kuhlii TaxID=59472 RepID=A0A7J7WEU2_PIPKU|nr:tetratricopeptide repeat domain 21A [Pipistrellus kuhlii]
MNSNDSSLMAGIIYYSQEKYFRHVQQAAATGLEKFSNDPVLQFFKAYGAFREGNVPHGPAELLGGPGGGEPDHRNLRELPARLGPQDEAVFGSAGLGADGGNRAQNPRKR